MVKHCHHNHNADDLEHNECIRCHLPLLVRARQCHPHTHACHCHRQNPQRCRNGFDCNADQDGSSADPADFKTHRLVKPHRRRSYRGSPPSVSAEIIFHYAETLILWYKDGHIGDCHKFIQSNTDNKYCEIVIHYQWIQPGRNWSREEEVVLTMDLTAERAHLRPRQEEIFLRIFFRIFLEYF